MQALLEKNTFFQAQNLEYAFDSLTKVLNREITTQYLNYLVDNKIPFSMCLCDIDNFKYVNDSYGHMMGDQVLVEVAKNVVASVGDKGLVGRYGGDEFIIVAEGVTEYEDIWNVCHRLNKDLIKMSIENIDGLSITLTTGVSRFPIDADNYEDILKTADKALYRGKTKGRNCFIIYLAEKHANLEYSRDRENLYNSMDMHARLFNILAKSGDIRKKAKFLLSFLSNSLMIDHVCIQTREKVVLSKVHSLATIKKVGYIDYNLLEKASNSIGLFYVSQRKTLNQVCYGALFESLAEQEVRSIMTCSIEAYGKKYGILRFDMCGKDRLWQTLEMDLIVTASKLLGTILYHLAIELDDLD